MISRLPIRFLALGSLFVGVGFAQQPAQAPPTRFAVEIAGDHGAPNGFVTLSTGICTSWFFASNLHRLPDSDPEIPQPSALGLEYKVVGDQVSITATAYYGDFDHHNFPPDTEKLSHEPAGIYSGRLNDELTLSDMEHVGLEPMTVKIVTPLSDHPYVPQTRSEAPSLQTEFAPLDRNTGMFTVHNLSDKAVTAVRLGASSNGSGWGNEIHQSGSKALVETGGTNQFQVSINSSGRNVDGKYVEDPPAEAIFLQAAVFADGTYEGERQYAVGMLANQTGRAVQRQRIQAIAEPILAEPRSAEPNLAEAPSSDQDKIRRILAASSELSSQPDQEMIETLRTQFPAMTGQELTGAQRQFTVGMEDEKRMLDLNLKQFLPGTGIQLHRNDLAKFWAAIYKTN